MAGAPGQATFSAEAHGKTERSALKTHLTTAPQQRVRWSGGSLPLNSAGAPGRPTLPASRATGLSVPRRRLPAATAAEEKKRGTAPDSCFKCRLHHGKQHTRRHTRPDNTGSSIWKPEEDVLCRITARQLQATVADIHILVHP